MTPLLSLCFIGLLIYLYKSRKADTVKREASPPTPVLPKPRIIIDESQVEFMYDSRDYEGKNHLYLSPDLYRSNLTEPRDFSYMSVDAAREELREGRKKGNWLNRDEYIGLMNVIHSERCKKLLPKINKMGDEVLRDWLSTQLSNEKYLTTEIWQYIIDRLTPVDAPLLLKELETIPSDETDEWVRRKKSKGYFFSDLVYQTAFEKRTVYIK